MEEGSDKVTLRAWTAVNTFPKEVFYRKVWSIKISSRPNPFDKFDKSHNFLWLPPVRLLLLLLLLPSCRLRILQKKTVYFFLLLKINIFYNFFTRVLVFLAVVSFCGKYWPLFGELSCITGQEWVREGGFGGSHSLGVSLVPLILMVSLMVSLTSATHWSHSLTGVTHWCHLTGGFGGKWQVCSWLPLTG